MEKKRTVVYGGAFNPPTIAHQIIFQSVLDFAHANEHDLFLLPSGDRTDKTILTPRPKRFDYINAMLTDANTYDLYIDILSLELDRKIPVETFDSVAELEVLFPEREFLWVFGADSTQTMGEWKNGSWLLDNLQTLLIRRTGSELNPLLKNSVVLDVITPEVSSTELRRRISAGEDFSDIVSNSVHQLLARG